MVELAEKKKRFDLIPIFYEIDPSALKSRTGCFNKAFEDHEKRFDAETVRKWRRAVDIVANISGWDSKTRSDDSKLIQEVVGDLCERLYSEPSDETSEFVGMSLHKKRIESLLSKDDSDDDDDVKMVGVWGMGGRGKTTIAKCVYESLSTHFPSRCFLGNVKDDFHKHGESSSSHLRKQIMSEIFPKSPLNARCVSPEAMKRRLRGKKVLLILDDVDDIQQLQELAGDCKWFGPGSRVIITTRDKRVLDEHSVKHIYEVKPLRTTQALQLLSKHAFKTNRPQAEFRQLCLDIVEQLCGLPLALRVIGASLYGRNIAFWEDKLCILRNSLDKSISTPLKVSYDALDEHEKTVFLYVAGCFNGEYMDRAIMVLDPFVIRSKPRLVTLMEKSLISMSNNTRLWVHDLLQDMAKDITCEGKMKKRKMMWNFLDIKGLFTETMAGGSKDIEVESIILNMAEETGLCVNPETFKRMRELKFLKIHNNSTAAGSKVCIVNVEDFDYLPPLRYLHWEAYNLKSLPAKFETNVLVELNLPDSSVETLWSGSQLGLRCTSIELVPDSISRLSKLTELRLSHCKRLKNLPDTFGNLTSLKHLTLTCCPNITVFPMLGNGIETLSLNGTPIEEVPSWIGDKVNLTCLDMSECKKLHNLPHSLRNLKNLKLLYLRGCINITEIPQVAGEMRRLDLYGTSIEKYGILSEEEALVLHNRDMDFLKGFLTRYVRMYKRKRNSR
ncbi:hypothetical protein HID58_022248 [Brassica napus]|uniref:TIR domain-containing protein n=1 Tax=Brassica napus TaxID=3708 RepID=A0ABQ8CYQ1_BRANA|nr:hypothetical protein HID58_022248 [Brassica napus]